jgi:positive regulator of sigma E activity
LRLRQINEGNADHAKVPPDRHIEIEERAMLKIAALVWIMLGTVLAGIAVMTVLSVPVWADQAMKYLPYAAIAGFIIAIPFAIVVARRMARPAIG